MLASSGFALSETAPAVSALGDVLKRPRGNCLESVFATLPLTNATCTPRDWDDVLEDSFQRPRLYRFVAERWQEFISR